MDPDIDFSAIFNEFDTILVGRRTFEGMVHAGNAPMPGMKTFVFSRTLHQRDHPNVTVVAEKPAETLAALRKKPERTSGCSAADYCSAAWPKRDSWTLLRSRSSPYSLGAGIPLLPSAAKPMKLNLTAHKLYKTGIVSLEYAIR